MTRKKDVLEHIANEYARKATYNKRKNEEGWRAQHPVSSMHGWYKSPYDPQPVIWPPSPGAIHRILTRFKEMPAMERSKKMLNHKEFLGQRITKANDQLRKLRKDNREKEMTHVMYQCLSAKDLLVTLSLVDLNDLGWVIDNKVKEIDRRAETLRDNAEPQPVHVACSEGAPGHVTTMNRQPRYMNYAVPPHLHQNVGPTFQNEDVAIDKFKNFYG